MKNRKGKKINSNLTRQIKQEKKIGNAEKAVASKLKRKADKEERKKILSLKKILIN